MTPPRIVPDWESFYIGLAYQYASRSKDPSTQCGAVVVDQQNIPLGFGYNGTPRSIPDKEVDWSRPEKYKFIKHAEENAIRHSRVPTIDGLQGCTIYVTGHPCSRCMLEIVDKGIRRVCYGPQAINMVHPKEMAESAMIAAMAGVQIDCFGGDLSWVKQRTDWMAGAGLFPNN